MADPLTNRIRSVAILADAAAASLEFGGKDSGPIAALMLLNQAHALLASCADRLAEQVASRPQGLTT